MAKQSTEVRRFPRIVAARAKEAASVRSSGLSQGAVYLAGYEVECLLKALLLTVTRPADRADLLEEFRGKVGHNLVHLRDAYREAAGAAMPRAINLAFLTVTGQWSPNLRYHPGTRYTGDVDEYFSSVEVVAAWARQRVSQ